MPHTDEVFRRREVGAPRRDVLRLEGVEACRANRGGEDTLPGEELAEDEAPRNLRAGDGRRQPPTELCQACLEDRDALVERLLDLLLGDGPCKVRWYESALWYFPSAVGEPCQRTTGRASGRGRGNGWIGDGGRDLPVASVG